MGTTVPTAGTPKRRRWSLRERRTKAERIAASERLHDELRRTRQEREDKWRAEEMARQEQLADLPPEVMAVEGRYPARRLAQRMARQRAADRKLHWEHIGREEIDVLDHPGTVDGYGIRRGG